MSIILRMKHNYLDKRDGRKYPTITIIHTIKIQRLAVHEKKVTSIKRAKYLFTRQEDIQ